MSFWGPSSPSKNPYRVNLNNFGQNDKIVLEVKVNDNIISNKRSIRIFHPRETDVLNLLNIVVVDKEINMLYVKCCIESI